MVDNMVVLTPQQRDRLKQAWIADNSARMQALRPQRSYLTFRRTVETLIGGDGCIMVPCKGSWLGIERDGYGHT